MEGQDLVPDNAGQQSKSYPAHFDGVAGWLGFLVASLLALGPVLTIVMTFAEISDTELMYPWVVGTALWQDAQLITWASVAAYIIVSVYAGLRLLRKHVPASVGIAIICLWVAGPIVGMVSLFALQTAGANPTAADVGAALGRPLVWATVWTVYLLLSRRVRNTYLDGKSLKAVAAMRLRTAGRRQRQIIFFVACWIVLSFLYFQIVAPLEPYPLDEEVQRMWAIILLPPVLICIGWWGYVRFVGEE